MITNYSDPIVTLNQEYRESDVGLVPSLGACIIGPNYYIRDHNTLNAQQLQALRVEDAANIFKSTSSVVRNLPLKTSQRQGDIKLESFKVYVKNALVSLASIEQGTIISGKAMEVSKSDIQNVKAGDILKVTYTPKGGKETYIKSYIYNIKQGSTENSFYVQLQEDLPSNIEKETINSVTFYGYREGYIDTKSVALKEFIEEEQKTVTEDWVDRDTKDIRIVFEAEPKLTLGNQSFSVTEGNMYVQYVAQNKTYQRLYGVISEQKYVEQLLGPVIPQNPLAIAVAAALSEAEGNNVYFVAVDASACTGGINTANAYNKSIDLIADKNPQYSIVPCITNDNEAFRYILEYLNQQAKQQVPVLKYLLANVQISNKYPLASLQEGVTGTHDFTVETVEGKSITVKEALVYFQEIQKGDYLTCNGIPYEIESASSSSKTITLLTQPQSSLKADAKVQIWHTIKQKGLDQNQQHVNHIVASKAFSDQRASIVFADGARFKGYQVANYVVAAAIAGMRSAKRPHAPLSNVAFKVISTSDLRGFTRSQLNVLGAHGFWRVGLNSEGQTISRRQLTSAASNDVNRDQQSIICNIDSICMQLKSIGKDIVGNTNITPLLLQLLQTTLQAKLASFEVYQDAFIGPQLLSSKITSIKQDSVFKDRIYAQMQGQPPKPFNRFHMKFYIN